MWRKGTVNLAVVGTARRCGRLLETFRQLPGVNLLGFFDFSDAPESRELAAELSIEFFGDPLGLQSVPELQLALNCTGDSSVSDLIRQNVGENVRVLDSQAARLVRILAMGYRTQSGKARRLQSLKKEYERYLHRDERIIGKSPLMLEVKDLVSKVADTPTTVLLLGETGTGKDLAARSLHQASRLRDKPFISINCTALSTSLMESELFGYKKGAFTGAESDRMGILEEADGGTVFLDEIGDMPLELQAKLLRFLQTGEIRRVGSTRNRYVTVRVIAATNRDLPKAVADGSFRTDLYYRFNTFTIYLPALRDRRMDIPYLAYHFLTKAEEKLNTKVEAITPAALQLLENYAWPGNVRELENVLERAVILCCGNAIDATDLPYEIRNQVEVCSPPDNSQTQPQTFAQAPNGGDADFSSQRDKIIANFERKELQYYIRKADGNISEASRLSGIPRRTFYRKMRKHRL